MFPGSDRRLVHNLFGAVLDCFEGRHPDYQAIDAKYHDLEHTFQGTLCMVRLLQNRHHVAAKPVLCTRDLELGVAAILLHDTGYLKLRGDHEGTGAKYTMTHVQRSSEFAERLLATLGFSPREIRAVQSMIHCTGINTGPRQLEFSTAEQRIVGYSLGTGDLLGQMAAPDYVEKLPILFDEFAEATRFVGKKVGATDFKSAEELMAKTPAFWERYVLPRLEREFEGVYRFLSEPFPEGPNEYLNRIEANVARLRACQQLPVT
jgi:hypothetical protein